MKTLCVNGKFLSQPTTGVQRYAAGVIQAWDEDLDCGRIDRSAYSIRLITPKTDRPIPQFKRIVVVPSVCGGRLWEQVELPLRSAGGVLFSPYAAAPVFKSRHIVTIHDAGVAATPEQYSPTFSRYYGAVYRYLGKSCIALFTVSNFSKQELHKYFSIPLERMTVIPPGCDHLLKVQPSPDILNRFGLEPGRFALGVSSQSSIKNFDGLARAWKLLGRPELKLAIAGRANSRVFQNGAGDLDRSVVWLGYVSDGELRALYGNAIIFVYPSFYEGFGIPPVEAMTCGCPVLVARSSALPESCGDAALYCDPSSPEDIAGKIASVLDNPQLAQALRVRGKLRAAQFTIQETASRLWSEVHKYL
ncbi:MAG: glycosyltransferase family 1 protein [Terracidiphilus sp.]|jgi:glycosyltransferase involved in cell wall biosynthesis